MVLHIPNDIASVMRLPARRMQEELLKELAIQLVREGILSRPQGSRLAGMERVEFYELLAKRQVPWEEDVDEVMRQLEAFEASSVNAPRDAEGSAK